MTIAAGFADPALDAQATFRCLLEAIAHPGRIVIAPDGLPAPPAPLLRAGLRRSPDPARLRDAALARPGAGDAAVIDSLRLHCGCPIVPQAKARFALLAGPGAPLAAFDQGTPEYPDRSATLIWQVREPRGRARRAAHRPRHPRPARGCTSRACRPISGRSGERTTGSSRWASTWCS